jgi:LemA protein
MIIALLVVLGLAVVYLIAVYNSLASLRIKIQEAWSAIDVQLKRRIELIPNLVETIKGYAQHEQEVFENVTQARSALMTAKNPKEAGEADQLLEGALGRLLAVAEAYPQLRASENFTQLQNELSDTADKVAYSRQFYNSVVRDYNSRTVVFPSNFVANMFGFKPEEFFEAKPEEREDVKVDFNTGK